MSMPWDEAEAGEGTGDGPPRQDVLPEDWSPPAAEPSASRGGNGRARLGFLVLAGLAAVRWLPRAAGNSGH
jgi:hypothetical protein